MSNDKLGNIPGQLRFEGLPFWRIANLFYVNSGNFHALASLFSAGYHRTTIPHVGPSMTPEERVRMNELCAGIQEERDYAKFVVSLREIAELIERKQQRRSRRPPLGANDAIAWASLPQDGQHGGRTPRAKDGDATKPPEGNFGTIGTSMCWE
jgi:hypothetical protein